MDLDNYARKSYNAMQAGLAVHAIDTMREGRVGRHNQYLWSPVEFYPGIYVPPECTSQDIFIKSENFCLPLTEPANQGATGGHK